MKRTRKSSQVRFGAFVAAYGTLGDTDRAFELLEMGFEEHNPFLLFLGTD